MHRRSTCRLCDSGDLTLVISLGHTPLANEFVSKEKLDQKQDQFPLDLYICNACAHVQMLDVVDPEILFRNYVYVSGTSPVFIEHFRKYSAAILELTHLPKGSRVLEIGSNDGTLLSFFKTAGMEVLGIDPARNIAEEATKKGIETWPEFFSPALAAKIKKERGAVDVVAANNVFAHADDLHSIVQGVAGLLSPNGIFVFEVSYLLDVYEKTLFDTIYHEHLSYHSVKPLVGLFERHGMELIDAVQVEPHGGSLRAVAKMKNGSLPKQPGVDALITREAALGLHGPAAYKKLFDDIQTLKKDLGKLLADLKSQGKKIAGFGAPAKATTLMYHFGLGPKELDYIIDDSPLKQGLFSPGHHIPVVPSSHLSDAAHKPDYLLILAWNFADSIIKKNQAFRVQGGHFIVPLPKLQLL